MKIKFLAISTLLFFGMSHSVWGLICPSNAVSLPPNRATHAVFCNNDAGAEVCWESNLGGTCGNDVAVTTIKVNGSIIKQFTKHGPGFVPDGSEERCTNDSDIELLAHIFSIGTHEVTTETRTNGGNPITNKFTVKVQTAPICDGDGDGIPNTVDNCQGIANGDQLDTDHDGAGDACDLDDDDDGCKDAEDQHPTDGNPIIAIKPSVPNTCPAEVVRSFEGNHSDADGLPDCKDTDDDDDGIPDGKDLCPTVKNDANKPLALVGCGFGVTSCPVIYNFPIGVCFGTTCIEDFRMKLDWVMDVMNPPIEVAIVDKFWIEAGNLYIAKGNLNGNRSSSLQDIARQLSRAPDSAPAGWFRLSIWSRSTSQFQTQLKAVVAEYAPGQITVSGAHFTGSSLRLLPPKLPGDKILIESSDKTGPSISDQKADDGYSANLLAILILVVVAGLALIAVKK